MYVCTCVWESVKDFTRVKHNPIRESFNKEKKANNEKAKSDDELKHENKQGNCKKVEIRTN